jgi:hypothetical protein
MADPGSFEQFFHEHAALSEELYERGQRQAARLLAAVGIDALAAIWEHDFSINEPASDLRLVKFMQTFLPADARTRKIAVVLFAEDLHQFGPVRLHALAQRLLADRNADPTVMKGFDFREMPHAHKDKDWADLVLEEPSLAPETAVEGIATRYTYPAMVYRLVRCASAHLLSSGHRVNDFSSPKGDDEVSYWGPMIVSGQRRPISIKFGIRLLTGWLRDGATSYVGQCARAGKRPADGLDANAESVAILAAKWKKIT